jgi:hypothetical protein
MDLILRKKFDEATWSEKLVAFLLENPTIGAKYTGEIVICLGQGGLCDITLKQKLLTSRKKTS